jgi:hypothetical protein
MPSKRHETDLQTSVASDCRHHWIIEYSQQVESKGRCRLCGEERTFVNKMSSPHKRPEIVIEALSLEGEISSSEPDDSGAKAI